ncbi:pseudouridine synthase [Streptomyces cinnamoneus]|uniref:Pseudouridine synthase n=1 Tax=Streptomyces cinnamoneus TaxID=53446 RepID=A0A2G1XB20_STRCJ|nr:pseudouridine synthase [Streptomyces cinnamoneus]PHQ48428.1 pseudouridine synthase [Streptomyces cinnamoneus]PPT12576.1 rRNA pseudouridine synthase [Streptomyces cinnamoneus]
MRSSGRNSGSGNRDDRGGRAGSPRPGSGGGRAGGGRSGGGRPESGGRSGGGYGGGRSEGGRSGGGRPESGGRSGGGRSGGGGYGGGRSEGGRYDGGRSGDRRDDRRDDRQQERPRRPRPEERRYDVGPDAERTRNGPTSGRTGGPSGARGAAARGGAKGGPRKSSTAGAGGRSSGPARGHGYAPARPRELDAKIEERNRERHNKPQVKTPKTFPGAEQEGERLQKVLARAGMGSRRACEELIEMARVEVNGEIVTEQGLRVDPEKDEIKVDGLTVATQSYLFFALNKPAGVVSTMEDPDGRQCLGDYVTNRETRLFHVGRLDTETEGIILLTNHGELAHRLTHPRYGVQKTYLAAITGPLPRDIGKQLKSGIELEDGWARADNFRVIQQTGKNYLVEVTLHEGRKHIVRRMLAEAGFPVEKLVRTSFGPIALGDQKSGWLRRLTNTEVGMLMREVDL